MKLSGGSPSFASELNIDAFLEQVNPLLVDLLRQRQAYTHVFTD